MAILNNEAAIKYAKELTETAMNNNMIESSSDADITAQFVFEFFETLYNSFTAKSKN